MNKIIIWALCALMSLSQTNFIKESSVAEKNEIPNPFVIFEDIKDAEKYANFEIQIPKINNLKVHEISAIKNELIQIVYLNNDREIFYRKAIGNEDISGDYSEYSEIKNFNIGKYLVTTKGNNGKISLVTWSFDGYTYSVSSDALDSNDLTKFIASTN